MSLNPPRIYQLFIVLMVLAYLFLPDTRLIGFPYNLIGLPVFVFGTLLALSAKRFFLDTETPIGVDARPNQLHLGGAFRYTRNPMYLGIATGLLGLALILSSALNFLLPLLFVGLMQSYFIPKEEANLDREFGTAYAEYKQTVPRWFGFWK